MKDVKELKEKEGRTISRLKAFLDNKKEEITKKSLEGSYSEEQREIDYNIYMFIQQIEVICDERGRY